MLICIPPSIHGLPQDLTSSPLGGSQLFFTGASWDMPEAVQCHVSAEMHSWTVLGRKGTFWTVCIWKFRSEPSESLQGTHEIYSVCFSGGDLMYLFSRRNSWYIKNSLVIVLSYRFAKTWVENKLSSSCQIKHTVGRQQQKELRWGTEGCTSRIFEPCDDERERDVISPIHL